jgi:tyrosyl-tRNA synthetase
MNLIEELTWRGLIQDIIPGTEKLLQNEKVKAYIGFDPTGDSLHIGSLVPIILLMHLQRAGHTPIALIGGATGMVGDPSGKSEERNMLDIEQIRANEKAIQLQISNFIDFDNNTNPAQIVNNYDWFKDFNFLDFIRDVGKYITVNYMMAKDSVQNRLKTGMSFTEFSYQLVQGYDFYHLYKNHGVKLQMGGSDQWGNIVTGTELIRKKMQGEAHAFTAPLIKKADGSKFGKTETGNVWLDPAKTTPYKFYQFWLGTRDEDVVSYLKIFTFLTKEEVEELIKEQEETNRIGLLQQKLAEEVTAFVHTKEAVVQVQEASNILFGKNTTEQLMALEESTLMEIMEGVPTINIELEKFKTGIDIVSFLADNNIYSSKGEARKNTLAGAVSINKTKVNDIAFNLDTTCLIAEKYILVQKGKKNYFLIIVS